MDCKSYLYESLTNPGAFLVPGFEHIMPDMRRQLADDQIWAVVAYLQSQGGEVTVTAQDYGKSTEAARGGRARCRGPGAHRHDGASGASQGEGMRRVSCARRYGSADRALRSTGWGGVCDRIRSGARSSCLTRTPPRAIEKFAGTMPATFGQQLSAAQLEAMVQFLAGRK